ncbi:hypothetical protein J2X47_000543 [Sphingomonas sp. BE270]|jgi:hypothetical protein|uniref:hypothetical protein n=1 Tax=Sphingomonas sp. BE270 TaxID=2817726 RepID=UPI002864BDC0|nr:hypothetical protein [Sphingomonas sp. BE270]MDR7256382.1 hypothetical protein [Sphingomonas sp. BE270]
MTDAFVPNERTQDHIEIRQQPDGPGLRYGKRGEVTAVAPIIPGTIELFRERIGQFQAEARYYEGRIGTVHELRVILINDDAQALVTVTYDGDFKPYLEDIIREAGSWFDFLFAGVWEGYGQAREPETQALILASLVTAEMFYVGHHDLSVKDVTRLKRQSAALTELLDSVN